MKEIVYLESAAGVFEPAPTRADKRRTKLASEQRAKRIETVQGAIGLGFLGIGYAAIFALFVFADQIWPAIRP